MFDLPLIEVTPTPFYYYDCQLLRETIETALAARPDDNYCIHYAIKANCDPGLLQLTASYGLGADCVSVGEVRMALEAGFPADKIVLAGVGKRDIELLFAIEHDIECINVESIEELEIINSLAEGMSRTARVALRINPDIDAHTHHYITTGLEEDKFGIDRRLLDRAVQYCLDHECLHLVGLHFHIGSQILTNEPFRILCGRVNEMVLQVNQLGAELEFVNVGGGLGVDYDDPDTHPMADFKGFFDTLAHNLHLGPNQKCLCELGRSIVAQCGSLISRVVIVKNGVGRKFVILDAGMNDLIRPALYQAHHKIQNLTSRSDKHELYDVVGPICESSDCFGKDERLPVTHRGDIIAIRTAGAYGQSMASTYNGRSLAPAVLV